eukprot:217130-Rhodomonas_salina.1
MWAWDILERVRTRGRFTAIVGPTALETCPTFGKWCLGEAQLQPAPAGRHNPGTAGCNPTRVA